MNSQVGATDRTSVRRFPEKAVTDRKKVNAILDAGLVAHVSCVVDGQPFVMPVGYARDGDRVLFHGSTASRLFKNLAAGQPCCLTVTLLDGVVLARSAFESSMNYRCVIALGSCEVLEGDEKERVFFEAHIQQLKANPNASKLFEKERRDLELMIAKIQQDVNQLDNNLGFVSRSKSGDAFRKQIEDKINAGKKRISEYKSKIKLLRTNE